jgi:hypothetical protein
LRGHGDVDVAAAATLIGEPARAALLIALTDIRDPHLNTGGARSTSR